MIKGAKSIAEYAIRKWLQSEGFEMRYFKLTVHNNDILKTSYPRTVVRIPGILHKAILLSTHLE